MQAGGHGCIHQFLLEFIIEFVNIAFANIVVYYGYVTIDRYTRNMKGDPHYGKEIYLQ